MRSSVRQGALSQTPSLAAELWQTTKGRLGCTGGIAWRKKTRRFLPNLCIRRRFFLARPRLSILLLWGLSPAIALTLTGVAMEFRIAWLVEVLSSIGMFGGPVVLLA